MKLSKLESPSNNVAHRVETSNHHTSLPLLIPSGSLHRTRPFLGPGESNAISEGHLQRFKYSQVPPPPPPPLHLCPPAPMQLMEPHTFVDFEGLSHPAHLWFSPHTNAGAVENAPPYHVAMNRINWTNSLPRHPYASAAMSMNSQQQHQQFQHRSAMNSPYLSTTGRSRGNKENAHMTYLCLESSKLETDI